MKKVLSLVLAGSMVLSLAACGRIQGYRKHNRQLRSFFC